MADCGCETKTKLVYACSGAADVGEIADKAARKLSKDGFGKLTCLAGVGAHLSGFIESAKAAGENIAIDGCPVACAKKNLEHVGVTPKSYILTEMGLVKGKTPATQEVVNDICVKISAKDKGSDTDTCDSGSGCCCG